MLTLYHAPTSVCSQKVRVGMALMGLTYDSQVLDLRRGDQFEPAYLALNRDAVVPTLVDDSVTVVESSLILEYLDHQHNAGRLMPQGRAEQVAARNWLLRCIAIHAAINTLSFSTAFRDAILANASPEKIEADAARFPDPILGQKRRELLANGVQSLYVGQALMHLHRMLIDMDTALEHAPWLGGAAIGIADVALIAYVDRLERLGMAGFWTTDAPRVGVWLAEWKQTDAYATGIEAHSPPGSADQMRAGGSKHWPALHIRWQALAR